MSLERLRLSFKPAKVKLLLIGESPPRGGDFFYKGDSGLLRATRHAFEIGLGWTHKPPPEFLEQFMEAGCYLEDLSHSPVNHLGDDVREARLRQSVKHLARRIERLEPVHVVAIIKSCSAEIIAAARKAEHTGEVPVLPFPLWPQSRERYVAALAEVLRRITS